MKVISLLQGFPTVASCLLDLPQLVAGFTNRFQVIAANIDSWRAKLSAKFKLYGSTIADLVTTSRSISYACNVNAGAASSSTEKLESLTQQLNRLEIRVSNNCDNILLIRGIIDQLCAISDSQVSLLTNQSQVLLGVCPLVPSLHVPTAVVEIPDPECSLSKGGPEEKSKEFKQSIVKPGSANVSVRGVNADRS